MERAGWRPSSFSRGDATSHVGACLKDGECHSWHLELLCSLTRLPKTPLGWHWDVVGIVVVLGAVAARAPQLAVQHLQQQPSAYEGCCARVDPDLCTTVAQAAAAGCPAVINPGEWHRGSPRSPQGEIWGGGTQGPSEDWGSPCGLGVEKGLWAIWRLSGCLQRSVSVLCFPFGLKDST